MSEIIKHPEYNNSDNPYPSFGKRYCGERGVISLTSWKMRIHTVAKTLYSLYTMCPGFHIVLVLSEEEFPKMMDELPENLKIFVDNELIEILWVYKNYKSFKKVLFTMDKYREVPVISADDDCIYTCNYAQELYDVWKQNKECVITNNGNTRFYAWSRGPNTLFPSIFKNVALLFLAKLKDIKYTDDDIFYGAICKKYHIQILDLHKKDFYCFHTQVEALSKKSTKPFNVLSSYFANIVA